MGAIVSSSKGPYRTGSVFAGIMSIPGEYYSYVIIMYVGIQN